MGARALDGIQLEPVGGFHSHEYFERFEAWLEQHVTVGNLVEEAMPAQLGPRARRFRVRGGEEVWQLVAPEDPFPGVFARHEELNRPSRARRFAGPLLMLGLAGLVAFFVVWAALRFLPLA